MTTYDAASIHQSDTLTDIRRRPGRYIIDTGAAGLTHLCLELLANAMDEVAEGEATRIEIVLRDDGAVVVSDDGRGIPVDRVEDGRSALEIAVLAPHSSAKRPGGPYQLPGGRNGLGLPVVAALSARLEIVVDRAGRRHQAAFVSTDDLPGQIVEPVRAAPSPSGRRRGTTVTMWPDRAVFGEATPDADVLDERLRTSVALHPGAVVEFRDERHATAVTSYSAPNGLATLLPTDVQDAARLGRAESERGLAIVAISPAAGEASVRAFVNDLEVSRGDHVDAARQLLDGEATHAVLGVRVRGPLFETDGAGVSLRSIAAAELVREAIADARHPS